MLVVNRFRVPRADVERFRAAVEELRGLLAGSRGFVSGSVGCNVDEPDLWVLVSTWADVGSCRRALSGHPAAWMTVMPWAVDEPSAFEVVEPGAPLNAALPRGG